MANPEHVQILKSGTDAIHSWKARRPGERLELSDADLCGLNLAGAPLAATDLREADLREAVLTGANLAQAVLSRARLAQADLSGAELHGANLRAAVLNDAVLRDAKLAHSDLRETTLTRADLTRARANAADFSSANLSGASLVDTLLCGAMLERAVLTGARLVGANLRQARLAGANLCEADFSGARIAGADLTGAWCGGTCWRTRDLAAAGGLGRLVHVGPSWIDVETILRHEGRWPIAFLRGCGLPEGLITRIGELAASANVLDSCFLCFHEQDAPFALKLIAALQKRGVRCWSAALPAKVERLEREGDDLRIAGTILLCLSRHLLSHPVLEKVVQSALFREKLFSEGQEAEVQLLKVLDLGGADLSGGDDSPDFFLPADRVVFDFSGWEQDDGRFDQGLDRILVELAGKDVSADRTARGVRPDESHRGRLFEAGRRQSNTGAHRASPGEFDCLKPQVRPAGRLLSGFRRLLRNDGGNSIWFDFRGQKSPTHHLRQLTAGNSLEWETAPAPDGPLEENVCFVFAGSFGACSEPESDGFAFSAGESEPVPFDLATSDNQWQNADGTVVLSFRMRWSSADDAAGFFYVSVNPELLTPGQPCRICVRALGSDSERWFGVNPVSDPVELEAANVSG